MVKDIERGMSILVCFHGYAEGKGGLVVVRRTALHDNLLLH